MPMNSRVHLALLAVAVLGGASVLAFGLPTGVALIVMAVILIGVVLYGLAASGRGSPGGV